MLTYLSKIDPNTVVALLSLLVAFGTWLYHRAKGDAKASLATTLEGLGKQAVHVLVTDPSLTSKPNLDTLRMRAFDVVTGLVARAGVPRNAFTDALIAQVVEHVIGDALAELRALDAGPYRTAPPPLPAKAA